MEFLVVPPYYPRKCPFSQWSGLAMFGTVLSQDPLMTPDIYSTKYLAIFTMACTMAITLGKPIGSRASSTTSISSRRCTWRLRLSSKGTEQSLADSKNSLKTLERKSRRHWPKSKRGNTSNSRVLGIYCMLMYMMYVTCSNVVPLLLPSHHFDDSSFRVQVTHARRLRIPQEQQENKLQIALVPYWRFQLSHDDHPLCTTSHNRKEPFLTGQEDIDRIHPRQSASP